MPRRETRHDIERALDAQPSKIRVRGGSPDAATLVRVQSQLERMRSSMDPAQFAHMEEGFRRMMRELGFELRKLRRRGDDGGMPALVEPPRGPTPLAGGAAAPLEFD